MQEYSLTSYSKGLDNKTRNLIILIVLFIGVTVAYFLTNQKLVKVIEELQAQNKKLNERLAQTITEIQREPEVSSLLEKVREEVFLTNKTMYSSDNPTLTLEYIFDIIDKYQNYLYFNFSVTASGVEESDNNVNFYLYNLDGQAYTNQLYAFIDQLERQPSFYAIESINLDQYSEEDEYGMVNFDIILKSFYASDGEKIENRKIENYHKRSLDNNIFYPRVHPVIIPEDDPAFNRLVDCEAVEVVALSRSSIYVREGGRIVFLKINDKVKFGRLKSINWEDQYAVFEINKVGISEKVKKKLPNNQME